MAKRSGPYWLAVLEKADQADWIKMLGAQTEYKGSIQGSKVIIVGENEMNQIIAAQAPKRNPKRAPAKSKGLC